MEVPQGTAFGTETVEAGDDRTTDGQRDSRGEFLWNMRFSNTGAPVVAILYAQPFLVAHVSCCIHAVFLVPGVTFAKHTMQSTLKTTLTGALPQLFHVVLIYIIK